MKRKDIKIFEKPEDYKNWKRRINLRTSKKAIEIGRSYIEKAKKEKDFTALKNNHVLYC